LAKNTRNSAVQNEFSLDRRTFCVAASAVLFQARARAQGEKTDAPIPLLSTPKIVGPIPVADGNVPYTSTLTQGSGPAHLMSEFNYIEEEYFLYGHANIYGPGVKLKTAIGAAGSNGLDVQRLKPLGGLVQAQMPYATRLLMIRPRDNSRFSGRVHAYPFHNVSTRVSVERNLLRGGDAVLGFEACSGTRFGPLEIPSGGIPQLHKFNAERYRDLFLSAANPADWPDLKPGSLAKAFETLDFGKVDASSSLFTEELYRSYAQAPDIMSQVAHALKNNNASLPFEGKVSRVFSYGASGGSGIMQAYIDYHHEAAFLPDGRPPFDGYLIAVGIMPDTRPRNAVFAMIEGEGEASKGWLTHRGEAPDTDNPRFRLYQLPGTGHLMSAPLSEVATPQVGTELRESAKVVPQGIVGLSDTGAPPEGVLPYDKINTPIIWGVWHNMYAWIEKGVPMPRAPRIDHDPKAADGIARDAHGNALGGLRTPWVDVPDATYLFQISQKDPLRAGMRPFSAEKMKSLYGSRQNYLKKVNAKIDRLVKERWIQAEDADLMRLKA
jgi:hypothetical protein